MLNIFKRFIGWIFRRPSKPELRHEHSSPEAEDQDTSPSEVRAVSKEESASTIESTAEEKAQEEQQGSVEPKPTPSVDDEEENSGEQDENSPEEAQKTQLEAVETEPTLPAGNDDEDQNEPEEKRPEAQQDAVEPEATSLVGIDGEKNGGELDETKPEKKKPEAQPEPVEPEPIPPVGSDDDDQNEPEEEKPEAQQDAVETKSTQPDDKENGADPKAPRKARPRRQEAGKSRKSRGNVSQSRNIGGRRGTSLEPPKRSDKERKQTEYAPAAELVCRERGREWEIALSVPGERAAASVQQNGETLPCVNGDYPLSSYPGSVSIKYEDGKEETIELDSDSSPMFFKMGSDWSGKGRWILSPRRGYIIALAPSTWKRIGDFSIEPQPCAVDGYAAHFFHIDADGNPVGFKEFQFQLTEGGFELEGATIHDDSDDGDLFIGDPPTLEADKNIVEFRVGPEGDTKNGEWKSSYFKPNEKSLSDVLNGREGRFFVRAFVAGSSRATDADQFRYCKDLREIRVNGERYAGDALITPGGEGHMPVKLKFIGKESARIRPRLKGGNGYAQVQADGSALIDPDKRGDETVWILGDDANEVEIGIHLPRVWWKLDSGGWTDKPISMTRQEFYEKREAKLTVSLPHFVKDVHAGFNGDLDRKISVKRGEPLFFSLLSFAYCDEIDKRLSADALLQIQCSGRVINLIRVAEDEPEKKLSNPDLCKQRKIRRNDGFSRLELQGADLSRDDARRMRCRVDKRRKSCHQHNIDLLEQKKRERDA